MAIEPRHHFRGPCGQVFLYSLAAGIIVGRLGIWAVTASCSKAKEGVTAVRDGGMACLARTAAVAKEGWTNYFAKRDVKIKPNS